MSDPAGILRVFGAHEVDFVVIGGVAVQAYGHPRTTRDLDLVVDTAPANAQRVADALVELDAAHRGGGVDDLPSPTDPATIAGGAALFLQTRYGLLDVMPEPDGAPPYDQLRDRCVSVQLGGVPVQLVGLDDLIALKRAADRPIDREDIAVLTDVQRRIAGARPRDLDTLDLEDKIDPAVALLGPRPQRGGAARAWDEASDYIYLYRDSFQVRCTAEQPIGPRPANGTHERRVWDRLAQRVESTRRKLHIRDLPIAGDLGEQLHASPDLGIDR